NAKHEGDPCQVKPCNTEFAIWSGPVIPDPARNRILLPYTEIHRTIGSLGWRTVGGGIAVWTPGGRVVRPIESPGTPAPTLMWTRDDVQYNAAWVAEGQTLYLYGEKLEFLTQHYLVARVKFADVLDESKWQYYTAAGTWSSNEDDAVGVFDGGAAGSTVFYNPYVGAYMAIYSAVFSNNVMYRVGSRPYGPWSNEALAFVGRAGWNGNTNYAGEAHPEYAQGTGQTQYVTYFHVTGFLRGDIPLVKVVFGPPA
ncbi:MAG TPA: DUF4185 domain-containing protein, partial [Actinomycetota bacterium]|nr:DUF4185 domain-containing protein [Actinomycetota bacterium]